MSTKAFRWLAGTSYHFPICLENAHYLSAETDRLKDHKRRYFNILLKKSSKKESPLRKVSSQVGYTQNFNKTRYDAV